MLEVSGSPLQVSLVAFMYGMPLLVVSPFAGALADRVKRQWLVGVVAKRCRARLRPACAHGGRWRRERATNPGDILHAGRHVLLLRAGTAGDPAQSLARGNGLQRRDLELFRHAPDGLFRAGAWPVLLLELTDVATTLTVQALLYAIGAGIYLRATLCLGATQTQEAFGRQYSVRLPGSHQLVAARTRALRPDRARPGFCSLRHALSES